MPKMTSLIPDNNIEWLYITDIEELESYTSMWHTCLQYTKDNIFTSPSWIIQWKNTFWQKNWSLHLYIVLKNNECILFAPFYIKKENKFPYLKNLHFIGQGEDEIHEISSEYQDILLHPDHHSLLNDLSHKLAALTFDRISINALLENAHLVTLFSKYTNVNISEAGKRYAYFLEPNTPLKLSKNTKSKLNKCKNKLNALNAELLWVNEKDYDEYWKVMENLHQIRWNKLNKTGAFSHTQFSKFHNNFRVKNKKNIKMSAVVVNNHPIAINYYIYTNDILYFYQSGWDEENYANISPGFALHIWAMENNKYLVYDYMMGSKENSYKSKFGCNHTRKMYRIELVKNKLKILLSKLLYKLIY